MQGSNAMMCLGVKDSNTRLINAFPSFSVQEMLKHCSVNVEFERETVTKTNKVNQYLSGQEIWCICLQHNAVKRDLTDRVSSLHRSEVGDQGCEAHIQVGKLCQEWLDHWITVCETVPESKSIKERIFID